MDADGSDDRFLAATTIYPVPPAWSPDGAQILFTQDSNLWVIPSAGGAAVQVTHLSGGAEAAEFPDWSPDGSKIAYARYDSVVWDIHVVAADGSGDRAVTDDEFLDLEPRWSPDGTELVFMSDARDPQTEPYAYQRIWTMDVEGTNRRRISSGNCDGRPTWSPDGARIAYIDGISAPTGHGLRSMATDGNDNQLIVPVSQGFLTGVDWAAAATTAPMIGVLSPTSRGVGATNQRVTVVGTNLTADSIVTVSGRGVRILSSTLADPTTLVLQLTVGPNAAPGARTMTVTNPDGAAATATFTVNPPPAPQSVDPPAPLRATTVVTVSGSGFDPTAGTLVKVSAVGVKVTLLSVTATSIQVELRTTNKATPGTYPLTVINADGGKGGCICAVIG